MTQRDRERLRSTFDQAAELYDRARPRYPAGLFDDLAELAGIGPGSSVLEIGPGTGQATVALAERGCRVVAVELGAALAAVARRNLARFPAVEVVTAPFEDWPLPEEPFDLVLAATAFHWIDPDVRVVKAADALRPGGVLATVTTHHIAGGDDSFFAQRGARPVPPVRPRDLPPLRMGAGLHHRRLCRGAPHLLRPSRPRPRSPVRPARLHRAPDRHRLRRPDRQALPDRAAGGIDHRSMTLSGPDPGLGTSDQWRRTTAS
jgi:SAM-dependent methyltransferase